MINKRDFSYRGEKFAPFYHTWPFTTMIDTQISIQFQFEEFSIAAKSDFAKFN